MNPRESNMTYSQLLCSFWQMKKGTSFLVLMILELSRSAERPRAQVRGVCHHSHGAGAISAKAIE